MKTKPNLKVATALLSLSTFTTFYVAQLTTCFAQGTAFTYQGRLNDGVNPASGIYDLRFTIYDSSGGPTIVAGPLTNSPTSVSNGLFTVTLDFGAGVFTGAERWIEIGLTTNVGGAFTTLSPRQQLTPTPYAIYASTAGTAASATSVAANAIGTTELQSSAVTFDKIADGTITAADVNSASFSKTFWKVDGNAGTAAGMHFLGTTDNQPLELKANNARALRLEPTATSPNLIGGYSGNSVTPGMDAAVIVGGGRAGAPNTAGAELTFIGGGWSNTNNGGGSFMGGGFFNRIETGAFDTVLAGGRENVIQTNADQSTISGGFHNVISNAVTYATVGGGRNNQAGAGEATVAGGGFNQALGFSSVIGGGGANATRSDWSAVAGGRQNAVAAASEYAFIGGGRLNTIATNSPTAIISGGYANSIASGSYLSAIGGGSFNGVQQNAFYSTIGGGNQNLIQVFAQHATIGGGQINTIGGNAFNSTIGGGNGNAIQSGSAATISGGQQNQSAGIATTVGGGDQNQMAGAYGFLGGGQNNTNAGMHSVLGGGSLNLNTGESSLLGGGLLNRAHGAQAVLVGGYGNTIGTNAYGAALVGGAENSLGNNASYSFIGGGSGNVIGTSTAYATIPGGESNRVTGFYSFAAGRRAHANNQGAFVWADAQNDDFNSIADNSFIIRAEGGVGINLNHPQSALHVNGTVTASGFAGSGTAMTGLDASQLASGTVAEARLSSNVVLRNATQSFTGNNAFFGTVGIGTSAPATALTVATGIGYGIEHTDGSRRLSTYLDAGGCWLGSVSADPLKFFVNNGVSAMTIDLASRVGIGRTPAANKLEVEGDASKTTAGSWLANSDARIKEDIQPVTGALDTLTKVRLVSFRYTDEYREQHASVEDRRYLNVVAQEFRKVFPEHVKSSGEKLPDGTEILQVDTYPLTIYSAAAIQELNRELKRRDAENAELKRELGELKQLVGSLAGKLNGGVK